MVRYVTFDADLTCLRKYAVPSCPKSKTLYFMTAMVILDTDTDTLLILSVHFPDQWSFRLIPAYFLNISQRLIHLVAPLFLVYHLSTIPKLIPASFIFKYIIFAFDAVLEASPIWVCFLKILISNDIEKNPGDFTNKCFLFATGI